MIPIKSLTHDIHLRYAFTARGSGGSMGATVGQAPAAMSLLPGQALFWVVDHEDQDIGLSSGKYWPFYGHLNIRNMIFSSASYFGVR